MAYYAVEPWGEAQAEYRAGMIASTVANTARDPKRRSKEFSATEFMRKSYLVEERGGSRGQTDENSLVAKAKLIFGALARRSKP